MFVWNGSRWYTVATVTVNLIMNNTTRRHGINLNNFHHFTAASTTGFIRMSDTEKSISVVVYKFVQVRMTGGRCVGHLNSGTN